MENTSTHYSVPKDGRKTTNLQERKSALELVLPDDGEITAYIVGREDMGGHVE